MKDNLNKFFRELRKKGYFARQNFLCCQSCALAEIPEGVEKYAFYHRQDKESLESNNEVYLAWGGDGKEICDVAENAGLRVFWNGQDNRRILISLT